MNKFCTFTLLCVVSVTAAGAEPERFISTLKLPSGQTVVVAEGDFEARSLGSFSLRVYDAAEPGDATTFFRAGEVRARDGAIEKVVLADVAGDPQPEVVVIVRSVGTGSYLSAQAFVVDPQQVRLQSVVQGLPATADPLAALRRAKPLTE